MVGVIILLVLVSGVLSILYYNSSKKKKKIAAYRLPNNAHDLLVNLVSFYRLLNKEQQATFRNRVRDFIARTKITAVGDVVLTELDSLLLGASAIIPIFSFPDWRYNNIDEVLIYGSNFNKGDFGIDGSFNDLLGMVGTGPLQGKMLITQQTLRRGFSEPRDAHNTALHEFIHLIDKADGATDGVPEYLLDKPYIMPWINLMHEEIQKIRMGRSDINPYAATNTAEFLAVVSEYFFERPFQLQEHHPELYELLARMFSPKNTK